MSQERGDLVVRRILVALDTSPHSQAALDAAAQLAARFSAQLLGLYVEDINLLQWAQSPFAREVGLFTATRRRLSAEELERQFRVQAERVRQMLNVIAERAELEWSFRVTRGAIVSELLSAASEVDLMILGRAGLSPMRWRRLGSTARAILAQGPCLTLILQESTCLGPPVVVVYDGSPLSRRALVAAAALIRELEEDGLTVLTLADEAEKRHQLEIDVTDWLKGRGLEARVLALGQVTVHRLIRMLQLEECGTLVVPVMPSLLSNGALGELLDEIEIPVLLVR